MADPTTILVVNDDEVVVAVITHILRKAGYTVLSATDGRAGVSAARAHRPDLVLMDVIMPEMDGVEACRQIKSDPELKATFVILVSGTFKSSEDQARGLETGGDGYIAWPMENRELLARVEAMLRIKRAEDALRESERRFRALIEHSADMITAVDAAGIVRYQSPSVERIIGVPVDMRLGNSAIEWVHPEDRAEVGKFFLDIVRTPGASARLTTRLRHRDGSFRWLESVWTNLLDEPAVQAIVINSRDITERKQFEERLRQTEKIEAIGRLAGGVAHDFNNMLTVISGYAELLQATFAPGDAAIDQTKEIINAAGRAADVVRHLLAFSQRALIRPQNMNVSERLRSLEPVLRRVAGETVDVRVDTREHTPSVSIDPGQLEQIIVNLVTNGRDAMPDGGVLSLSVRDAEFDESCARTNADVKPGRYVLLEASDTGPGMDEQTRSHVFEPFFVLNAEPGAGLGLPSVYGIALQNNGHATCDSEPGRGTVFSIYLPAVERAAESATRSVEGLLRGWETILLVEDEKEILELGRSVLERQGYTVLSARSGADAICVAEEHRGRIDLLVTDVVMPEMNGLQLSERLLESRPDMKVLYVSGYAENVLLHHGLAKEGVSFVAKPYRMTEMLDAVRAVLGG